MLHTMVGRLAKDPELKTVQTNKGETMVSNNFIYVWTNQGKDVKDVPVKITAWGDVAQDLSNYKKGDAIQFIGKLVAEVYKPKGTDISISTIGYEVKKIDSNNLIFTTINKMLQDIIDQGKGKEQSISPTQINDSPVEDIQPEAEIER